MKSVLRFFGVAAVVAMVSLPGFATPLAPFIDLQEAGLTVVHDGAGMRGTLPVTLTVNIGGTVRFALLYWNGRDTACPITGSTCTFTQPYLDQQMNFNGTNITGTVIGTETQPTLLINNIGYFADVTSIVSAAGTGVQSFTFDDQNAASNFDIREGVSLFVAYTNASDPLVYRVLVFDNLDFASGPDPDAGDPRTTAAINFTHGALGYARTAQLFTFTGDGDAALADETTVSNNPTLFNLHNASDGLASDMDEVSINIPAGVATTTVQVNSPTTLGDDLLWQMGALRVAVTENVDPTCGFVESAGPPKVVTFVVQDTGSGVASIVVTQSSNADTVVPPFTVGQTTPITVTSTKIDQTQPMTISFIVTDVDGNVSTCGYDDSPCVLTCPANISVANNTDQCGAIVFFTPTTSGACGTVTSSPISGSFFGVGTTTVNVSATAGNTCSFSVTVNDTQPPTLVCAADVTVPATSSSGAVANYFPPNLQDNCAGATVSCAPPSGASFPLGTTTVTCTAPDAAGNVATCGLDVTVTPVADLSIDKSGPATVGVGIPTTFSIAVQNLGPQPATNVTVSDSATNATITSATPSQGSCVGTAPLICNLGTLASGATATIDVVLEGTAAGPFTNTASVSASESDPNLGNNSDVVGGAVATNIPTLSTWMLMILAAVLAGIGIFRHRA